MPFFHLLLTLLVVIAWGVNFVVVQLGLHEIPPLLLCAIRFFLTAFPAVFFLPRPKIPLKTLILYGLIMYAIQFCCIFGGIYAGVAAGLASLIMQMQLFFTILLAALLLHERPTSWQILGMLISFSGIALVAAKLNGSVSLVGFILLLAASMAWGIGNLLSKKMKKVNMFSLVVWGNLIAFFPVLLSALLFEKQTFTLMAIPHLSWITIAAILYIVYCSTFFGYGTWGWLLSQHPIATIAPYAMLIPIVGLISASLVLHEPLQPWKLLAGLLVISGLGVNFLGLRWTNNRYTQKSAIPEHSNQPVVQATSIIAGNEE